MDPYNRPISGSGSSLRRTSYASVAASAASLVSHGPLAPTARTVSYSQNAAGGASYPPATQPSRHSRSLEDSSWNYTGTSMSSRTSIPPYSHSMGFAGGFAGVGLGGGFGPLETPVPPPVIPSYLQGSKYAENLEEAHRIRVNAQRDAHHSGHNRSPHWSNAGSLSSSASSANLPKMVPSHRGMTHDIIERAPPLFTEEPYVPPLPTKWSETDRHKALDIRLDGLEAAYTGTNPLKGGSQNEEACAVRADQPMPKAAGIYYWECAVQARNKEVWIGIGFCGPNSTLERLPGWEQESWAYHGDDGQIFSSHPQGKAYGGAQHRYGPTDTIGCGVNFRTGEAFFTKNGNYLGLAFSNIKADKLFPCVGMKKAGEGVKANFGQRPFVYDINAHVRRERERVQEQISRTSVANLSPPLDENSLIQKLVAQYLSMDGYVETARAFASEVGTEVEMLNNGSDNRGAVLDLKPERDIDAIKRQQIRTAVLRGDIDLALKLMKLHYNKVLKENENIYFKLKCRKYIEMIRKVDEQRHQHFATESPKKTSSHTSLPQPSFGEDFHDVFGHGMELDDQLQLSIPGITGNTSNGFSLAGENGERMDTDSRLSTANGAADEVPSPIGPVTEGDLIRYGTELQLEFKDDPRREVKKALEDTLALIAYENPRESPLAHLLEERGRAPVAEELNGAILVSLGKAASSGLERLVQQAEVLVDKLAEDGGVGTMVNVRGDYLR